MRSACTTWPCAAACWRIPMISWFLYHSPAGSFEPTERQRRIEYETIFRLRNDLYSLPFLQPKFLQWRQLQRRRFVCAHMHRSPFIAQVSLSYAEISCAMCVCSTSSCHLFLFIFSSLLSSVGRLKLRPTPPPSPRRRLRRTWTNGQRRISLKTWMLRSEHCLPLVSRSSRNSTTSCCGSMWPKARKSS